MNEFDDDDIYIEEESMAIDLVCRIEEAQKAIAWAVKAYIPLYGKLPDEGSWSVIMDHLVACSNIIKGEEAEGSGMFWEN